MTTKHTESRRRSWLAESASRRSGGGTHRPSRAWRERDALAEAEAWAEADELETATTEEK